MVFVEYSCVGIDRFEVSFIQILNKKTQFAFGPVPLTIMFRSYRGFMGFYSNLLGVITMFLAIKVSSNMSTCLCPWKLFQAHQSGEKKWPSPSLLRRSRQPQAGPDGPVMAVSNFFPRQLWTMEVIIARTGEATPSNWSLESYKLVCDSTYSRCIHIHQTNFSQFNYQWHLLIGLIQSLDSKYETSNGSWPNG